MEADRALPIHFVRNMVAEYFKKGRGARARGEDFSVMVV